MLVLADVHLKCDLLDRLVRYDTIEEINVDSKAEYAA